MLRSNLVLSLVAGCCVFAAPVGVAFAEVKIGVVNLEALMQESPQFKAMGQTLQDEFAPRQREILQQQQNFKAKAEKFQRDSAVMSDAEKSKMERELREAQRDLERKSNEFKDDANLRQNEELGKLQRALIAEVQSYAKSGNFDLVVGQGAAVFHKDALDITRPVLAAIQAKAPKPAAAPAAPPAKP
jgi:outer membrane protein